MDVSGWRKNMQRTAGVLLHHAPRLYAARTGRPDDVGRDRRGRYNKRKPPEPVAIEPPWRPAPFAKSESSGRALARGASAERTKCATPPPSARTPTRRWGTGTAGRRAIPRAGGLRARDAGPWRRSRSTTTACRTWWPRADPRRRRGRAIRIPSRASCRIRFALPLLAPAARRVRRRRSRRRGSETPRVSETDERSSRLRGRGTPARSTCLYAAPQGTVFRFHLPLSCPRGRRRGIFQEVWRRRSEARSRFDRARVHHLDLRHRAQPARGPRPQEGNRAGAHGGGLRRAAGHRPAGRSANEP